MLLRLLKKLISVAWCIPPKVVHFGMIQGAAIFLACLKSIDLNVLIMSFMIFAPLKKDN